MTGQDAAGRAERKKARLAVPPPELADEFAELSLADLRHLRAELTDYETRVSYWRRLVHARMDNLREDRDAQDLDRLAESLADAPSRSRRIANLAILPIDETPPLPDLDDLWRQDPRTEEDIATYLDQLTVVEHELSAHRQALFGRIDAVHTELIARYRQNPALALELLPQGGFH